jgi:hypothetical protein
MILSSSRTRARLRILRFVLFWFEFYHFCSCRRIQAAAAVVVEEEVDHHVVVETVVHRLRVVHAVRPIMVLVVDVRELFRFTLI